MPVLSIALVIYLLMLPVTGMVPVLSALTAERYPETGDLARHAFMSMNMIGALLAAPCAGWLSDRLGRRRAIIIGALVLNALTLLLIAGPWPYPIMLTVRFIEGCAHMSALSLLMTLGAEHARRNGLAPVMGGIGAAISLGVASGAPLGGWVGSYGAELVPLAAPQARHSRRCASKRCCSYRMSFPLSTGLPSASSCRPFRSIWPA